MRRNADLQRAECEQVGNSPQPQPVAVDRLLDSRPASVPRNYIRTLKARFIREADAFAFKNPTKIYDIESRRSPFISQPAALADILIAVASARGDEALTRWAR
jgi:hypothetical protein